MSERRIHTMWKMIAIRNEGHVLAVFPQSFGALVDLLLSDLDPLERVSFKMAASVISATALSEHKIKMPQWEETFLFRLKQRISELGHLLTFSLEGDEARQYLPDILESYRGNNYDGFSFDIDDLHGHSQSMLTISTYDEPTFWKRLVKSERAPRQRVNVLLNDIRSITGTSLQLELRTLRTALRLTKDGSIVESNT